MSSVVIVMSLLQLFYFMMNIKQKETLGAKSEPSR